MVTVLFLVKAAQSLFVSPLIEPLPLSDSTSPTPAEIHPKIKSYEQYIFVKNSNLFGALASSNVSAKVEEKLPETTLDLELLGCVSAYDPQLSFAIIRDKKGRSENTYAVGDVIVGDAKVEEVRENEVVISRAGQREVLAMTFTDESPFKSTLPFMDMRAQAFTAPYASTS
jgi:type II secretory pathway component PulC